MPLRILSVGGPLWVYATIALLLYGLFLARTRFEWIALAPAAAGFLASALLLAPVHRLFFDEDVYINVASNLTRAPVNQLTMMGGPNGIEISTYPKEPAGWPVLLSFAFLSAGTHESVAFWFARLLFALAITAVYHLARALRLERKQAIVAAIMFGATPICFWYSVSAGTDVTAALMAVLGMWGLVSENGPLAAGGFAFAAQTRMELLLLVPLVWISPKISLKWKIASAGLALFEVVHVMWVFSVAATLERVEEVQSAFGFGHVGSNFLDNIKYLFNPFAFPIMISVLATLALKSSVSDPLPLRGSPPLEGETASGAGRFSTLLIVWTLGLFAVYLSFYAGSFNMNTRYSIQILAPLTLLAACAARRWVWIAALPLSAVIPAVHPYVVAPSVQVQALQADHDLSIQFASRIQPNDFVISGVQELFIDQGRRSVNASFASMMGARLNEEIRKSGKVWYHSGIRANVPNSDEWRADRWVKSNFELHLIDSHEVGGFRIAFYEILTNRSNRETG